MNQNNSEVPVKLYRTKERVTVAAPLPGLEPQDIAITVSDDGELTIEGRLRGAFKGDKEVLLDEWSAGSYFRHLSLPAPVDASLANFTYANGIVVLTLPVAEATVAASLTLERIGSTVGQRIRNAGHPVRATSMAEHHAKKMQVGVDKKPEYLPSASRELTREVSESVARHPEGPAPGGDPPGR